MNIVPIIQEHLQKNGWTQKELAKQADLPVTTINSIMLGKVKAPSILACFRIARAFGITIDELIPIKE